MHLSEIIETVVSSESDAKLPANQKFNCYFFCVKLGVVWKLWWKEGSVLIIIININNNSK